MNIFQKSKAFFSGIKRKMMKETHNVPRSPIVTVRAAIIEREAKHWTRRQWAKIKHRKQISARSRMTNLMKG
jgi:hypothetical protein